MRIFLHSFFSFFAMELVPPPSAPGAAETATSKTRWQVRYSGCKKAGEAVAGRRGGGGRARRDAATHSSCWAYSSSPISSASCSAAAMIASSSDAGWSRF